MTGRRRWTTDLIVGCYAMAWMAPMPALPSEFLQPYLGPVRRDRHNATRRSFRRSRNASGAAVPAEACA
jgi:hypothetical protein